MTLVLGASLNENRYSNMVIHELVSTNKSVVAVGMQNGFVAGVQIYKELHFFDNIDTISLYVGPKNQAFYYDYVISLHPKRIIFNPGTSNLEFEELLIKNNIAFEYSCTLVLLKTGQY